MYTINVPVQSIFEALLPPHVPHTNTYTHMYIKLYVYYSETLHTCKQSIHQYQSTLKPDTHTPTVLTCTHMFTHKRMSHTLNPLY